VQPVEEIEQQRDGDQADQEGKAECGGVDGNPAGAGLEPAIKRASP
jgi:hypothetical protein